MMSREVSFWAEVSSNHQQDTERCFRFIDSAARLGCQAVKFQLFRIDELFAPEVLAQSEEHRRRRDWELPRELVPELARRCREVGIELACTPFDLDAVELLEPHVDHLKIASYELLWNDLLKACAQTGKPVTLSTGMATMDEVEEAVQVLRDAGCSDPTLLHCTSSYPTPPSECNLATIDTLRRATGCAVGWSDHSRNPGVILRALHRWGASIVEFHLDLDGQGAEFAMGHCWLPHEIRPVIEALRLGLDADGEGLKKPAPSERSDREWRADPSDGLRPLLHVREELVQKRGNEGES